MKNIRNLFFILLALMLLLGGGVYVFRPKAPATLPEEAIATASFYDLKDTVQPLAQWKGKVMVLNFWGTWCPPCRAEIPEFIRFQKQYEKQGVQFVGVAIDQKSKAQAYATELGINYPILLGDLAGIDLARRIGNAEGGLPYTVITDRGGKVIATQLGTISYEKLESIVKPLL